MVRRANRWLGAGSRQDMEAQQGRMHVLYWLCVTTARVSGGDCTTRRTGASAPLEGALIVARWTDCSRRDGRADRRCSGAGAGVEA